MDGVSTTSDAQRFSSKVLAGILGAYLHQFMREGHIWLVCEQVQQGSGFRALG